MSITQLTEQETPEVLSQNAPIVDIVAIHGLYERALETWTDSETGLLWLRDLFPHRQCRARILVYGYKAETLASPGEGSADRILPHATSLVAELCADRQLANAFERPIIFICHGLGGLLVKRALAFSSTSRSRNVEHRRSVYVSTYAILFMGTPHTGIGKDALLLPSKGEGAGPSQFMISLLKGSEMLQEITDQFAPLLKHFCVYYFWEQMETQAETIKTYVVDEDSAAPGWDNVDRCGIMATHSGMVKFKNSLDRGYRVVLDALLRYIKAAPGLIQSRWANDLKQLAEERQREAEALLQPQRPHFLSEDGVSTTINELYYVPRCSSNYFTGRTTYAKVLRDRLGPVHRQQMNKSHRAFVICGLGGSGKTQFCLKYVEDNKSSYWGVFWIDASNQENAERGFSFLGEQAGKGLSFAAGIHWLSNCLKPWLLVLDNVDDPDMDISQYFPPGGKGHILVTTRNPGVTDYANAGEFRFRGMDPEEAIELLLKSSHSPNASDPANPQDRKMAQGIASELGYLPLALAHAGATIRRNIYTMEKYLHYYLRRRKDMILLPHVNCADDANIIATWEIPFQRIAISQSVGCKDAAELMHVFAFMHHESIPESIFRRSWDDVTSTKYKPIKYPDILQNKAVWGEDAQARLRTAIRVLYEYSIIDHDPGYGICSLHPVVHAWARERLTEAEQTRWLSCTASILANCISLNLEASGQQFRRRLLPHIDFCQRALDSQKLSFPSTTEQAAQLYRFASVYAENGLWKRACGLQSKVVKLRTKKLGKWHEDTLQAKRSLAYTYWNLFNIKLAVDVQKEVLFSRWVWRPSIAHYITWPPWRPNYISYCVALDDLTLTLWLAGEREWSKYTGERALKGLMNHLGPEDPRTLSAMFNLGRTYLHLGQPEKCQELLVAVVNKRRRFFGPNHPDTLMARNELGMSYCAQKRFAVAEILVRNVLETRKRILGEEHSYTLWSVNDMSKVICDRGQPAEAAKMLEDIIPVVSRTLGESHIGMSMTKSNLARAYVRLKRWKEAAELLKVIIPGIPSSHPDWFHAMSGYVEARIYLGELAEAEKDCSAMLDRITNQKALTLDNPRTVVIAEQLLKIYCAQARYSEISALKKRFPAMNENVDQLPHFDIIPVRRELEGAKT